MRIVIATGNAGKLREFKEILIPRFGERLELVSLSSLPDVVLPAEGDDYQANALAKARAVSEQAGFVALGDDSGLEVDALAGAPGPHSARYGGAGLDDGGRIGHLLEELRRSGSRDRHARFVCEMALTTPKGEVRTARGECVGEIRSEPFGGGGFGYDPIFEPDGHTITMAELTPEQKNEISHRGRALEALGKDLLALLNGGG